MITIVIAVSGGLTSSFLAEWMIENKSFVATLLGYLEHEITYVFCFANTGREEDDTLRFMNDVDTRIIQPAGYKVVWLEAVVHHGIKKASTHRVVTYETAMRKHQWKEPKHPFTEYVRKYGVPNVKMKSCTRELKLNPIKSYMRSIGHKPGTYHNAVGIRIDEPDRVGISQEYNKIYPLVHWVPTDKEDVLIHWEDRDWNLKIPQYRGNCITCFKKSFKKLNTVYNETPDDFEFNDFIEKEYGFVGPEFEKHGRTKPRVNFREERSTQDMIALFRINKSNPRNYIDDSDAGCSEECGAFDL